MKADSSRALPKPIPKQSQGAKKFPDPDQLRDKS